MRLSRLVGATVAAVGAAVALLVPAVASASIAELGDNGVSLRIAAEPGEQNDVRVSVTDRAYGSGDDPITGVFFSITDIAYQPGWQGQQGDFVSHIRPGNGCISHTGGGTVNGTPVTTVYCDRTQVTHVSVALGDNPMPWESVSFIRGGYQADEGLSPYSTHLDGGPGPNDTLSDFPGPTEFTDSGGSGDQISGWGWGGYRSTRPVRVSLDGLPNDGVVGEQQDDVGSGIDVVEGGWGDDVLIGNSGDNWLVGGAGHDRLVGKGGDDFLWGDAMSGFKNWNEPVDAGDSFDGGPGHDEIYAAQWDRETDPVPSNVKCGGGFDDVTMKTGDLIALDCESYGDVITRKHYDPGETRDVLMHGGRLDVSAGIGEVGVECTADAPTMCSGGISITARVGGASFKSGAASVGSTSRLLGRARFKLRKGKRQRVTVRLSPAARTLLRGRKGVPVQATVAFKRYGKKKTRLVTHHLILTTRP